MSDKMQLRNWTIIFTANGSMVAKGKIYNDERGRFEDGVGVTTSAIQTGMICENGHIDTKSSTYYLGECKKI